MKKVLLAGSLALAVVVASVVAFSELGEAEHGEHRGRHGYSKHGERGHEVSAVTDAVTLKECGACHMAFQAGWLPVRSWEKMMSNLKDHFGDNASLNEATAKSISEYLIANASDATGRGGRGEVASGASLAEPPSRITELAWFRAKHDKRNRTSPETMKRRGAKSKADCKACHPAADKGYFEDD
jgi:hypothetical protein